MSTRRHSLLHRIGAAVDVFASATAVVAAQEAGQQPRARDLQRLGIDAAAYRAIGR